MEPFALLRTPEFNALTVLATVCLVVWQEVWLFVRKRRGGLTIEVLNQLNAAFSRMRMPAAEQQTREAKS